MKIVIAGAAIKLPLGIAFIIINAKAHIRKNATATIFINLFLIIVFLIF